MISPGALTYIAVQRTIVKQLEKPYSDCLSKTESILYKRIVSLNASYTRMDCVSLCRQLIIERKCGCYDMYHPSIALNRSCNSSLELECNTYHNNLFNENELPQECSDLCPVECTKMIFTPIQSQINQFSIEKAEQYMENSFIKSKFNETSPTYEDIKMSIVNLNIYYDRLSFTEVTEKPSFTFVDLISNVGGTFGLFIGISLLSVLEIVEIIFELLLLFKSKLSIHVKA